MSKPFNVLHLPRIPLTRTQFILKLERLQFPTDLTLASETQHSIAGDLLFGHGDDVLYSDFFVVECEAEWMRCSVFFEVG